MGTIGSFVCNDIILILAEFGFYAYEHIAKNQLTTDTRALQLVTSKSSEIDRLLPEVAYDFKRD